jgi:hypothetical protein
MILTLVPACRFSNRSLGARGDSTSCAPDWPVILPRGPDQIPHQLAGLWEVGLCLGNQHAWIRYQNLHTGQVHTVARFLEGFGGYTDRETGQLVVPNVPVSGVWWDQDLRFEKLVADGKFLFVTVVVQDPVIWRAKGKVFGYHLARDNCVHFVRDAWHFYSGEWYDLPAVTIPTPTHLGLKVRTRHSNIPLNKRCVSPLQ